MRIIDKAPQASDKSKALVVWSRTLELLDKLGLADAIRRDRTAGRRREHLRRRQAAGRISRSTIPSRPSPTR